MHMHKRAVKNSLFKVVSELNRNMYPSGMKEEIKYVEELYYILNRNYSKVVIANMLRRIMSYIILNNSPVFESAVSLSKKQIKTITEKELSIVIQYIIANNKYISIQYSYLIQNDSKNV